MVMSKQVEIQTDDEDDDCMITWYQSLFDDLDKYTISKPEYEQSLRLRNDETWHNKNQLRPWS